MMWNTKIEGVKKKDMEPDEDTKEDFGRVIRKIQSTEALGCNSESL